MSITYPPEMLPKAYADEEAEVVVVCPLCGGSGLIQETSQEDERWEMWTCPRCGDAADKR